MINIKNFTIFKCSIDESFHWSKLPKLEQLMYKERFNLRFANLSSADLSSANLRSANLSSANLSSADLSSANLRFANLSSADLSSANLRFADLSSADLSFANLRFANLSSANLRFADLSSAKLKSIDDKDVIIEDFMSVCGLGSQNRQTLIFKTNIGIVLHCGCFYGTEKDFKKKVEETHNDNNYAKEYLEMLKLAKIRFKRSKNE